MHQHQPFGPVALDREGGVAALAQRRVAGRGDGFQVLGIVVAAVQDDQFLQATGHEQFAVTKKPRSPVRMNGPSPLASRAWKVCSVSAARFQ